MLNYAGILPLFLLAFGYLLYRKSRGGEGFMWRLFYLVFFAIFFNYCFLPLTWRPGSLDFSLLLEQALRNPLLALSEEAEALLPSLRAGLPLPLISFLLLHVGRFLLFMPLADFIYSGWPFVRRQAFAVLSLVAVALLVVSFLLSYLSGRVLPYMSLTALFEGLLGAAFFLLLSALLDKRP